MGIIRNRVEGAYRGYMKDKNLPKLLRKLVDIADHLVHYQHHRDCLDRAMDEFFPMKEKQQRDV